MEKMGVYIDSKIIRKFNTRVDDVFREMRTYVGLNFGEQNRNEFEAILFQL
jgi:hypothetical protein